MATGTCLLGAFGARPRSIGKDSALQNDGGASASVIAGPMSQIIGLRAFRTGRLSSIVGGMDQAPKTIGIVGYPGVNGFDVAGPAEVFASARGSAGNTAYSVEVLATDDAPFRTEAGLIMQPNRRLDEVTSLDTIIVPGGAGLRQSAAGAAIATWLRARSAGIRRVAAVCTGSYGLAEAGLLDGRRATTHWRFAADLQTRYPDISVEPDMIFLKDKGVYTSGGIAAGIDLALALVEEDLGPNAALAVAREMVVFLKRGGGQHQYSEPLRFQVRSSDRFADLLAWISEALDEDLSVGRLAQKVCLEPRQFTRAFRKSVGLTPAVYVEHLRIDRAAGILVTSGLTVDQTAAQVGYRSADVFRRAFERRFRVAPGEYRRRFSTLSDTGAVSDRRSRA